MGAVEALRIDPVELAHALRQIGFRRLDQDVVMVRHLAPGMANPIEAFAYVAEHFEPGFTIGASEINILAPISAGGDVIYPASQFKP